tara:strand:- start:156 stop:398 length:243 start_codon:yes stop_codon:yes gene_type:complete
MKEIIRASKRTQTLNIRVCPEDKLQLEVLARREGFSSLSEFTRTLILKDRNLHAKVNDISENVAQILNTLPIKRKEKDND